MDRHVYMPVSIKKIPAPSRTCLLRSADANGDAGLTGGGGIGAGFLFFTVLAIWADKSTTIQY